MNIVVGYSESPLGRPLIDAGMAEARLRGARLHVLHFARIGLRNEDPSVLSRYRDRMAAIAEQLQRAGIDGVSELRMVQQDPADALLAELEDLDAELLVIASRARSRVGKLLLGSTVQHLLLRADCPVLVVRRGDA